MLRLKEKEPEKPEKPEKPELVLELAEVGDDIVLRIKDVPQRGNLLRINKRDHTFRRMAYVGENFGFDLGFDYRIVIE